MANPTDQLTAEQLETLQKLLDQQTANTAPGSAPAQSGVPAAPAPAPPSPTPLEFDFHGQHYTARDGAELQRLLDQAAEQQRLATEGERVRAEAERQRQAGTQPQASYSQEKFAELFLKDAREAYRYQMQHDPAQLQLWTSVAAEIEGLKRDTAVTKQELAANKFVATTDWPATPENAQVLNAVMTEFNLPWNEKGMQAGYEIAKSQKRIKFTAASNEGSEQPDGPVRTPAPPSLPRKRARVNDESEVLDRFASLPHDQQKKYLEEMFSR